MMWIVLPGLTGAAELTICAHPALAGDEDPRIDAGQHGIGQFSELPTMGGGADGVMLFEFRRL